MLSNKDRVRNPWTNTLARLEDERIMLQRIAAGVPLTDVLLYVLHAVEAQSSVRLRTAISFTDEEGTHLVHGAAPSFSERYRQAVNGVPIGPHSTSWGATVYFGTAIYVNDVLTDPTWSDWREFAIEHGIRACWSTPIKGTDGRMLGVFSNYYAAPRLPSPQDIDAIALVTRTAALAIERSQYDRELEKRVELAIAERDRIWRLSPELLAIVNAEGRYVSVNPAVRAILGWTPEEFLAMPLTEAVHPDDYAATEQVLVPADKAGDAPRHLENRMKNSSGNYRRITWTISRSRGDLYLAGRDDTDLREQAEALHEAETALRQSQKMEAVGQLTGGIAHDFNNMLQGISGALYLIRRKLAAGNLDAAERFIDTATESTERAARLTQRLLVLAGRQPNASIPLCSTHTLRSSATSDEHSLPVAADDCRSKTVVALVEDDSVVREMVYEALTQLHMEVLTAADGIEGRALLNAAKQVDLLLTDVGLPRMNGRELADSARQAHPGIKVLFMTGDAQNAVTIQRFLGEGTSLIVKPFKLDSLLERVHWLLQA